MSIEQALKARLGGRELVTIDPYDCPTCGRRILGRRPHEGTGPCKACLTKAGETEEAPS